MLLDNGAFKAVFLVVAVGSLLLVWSGGSVQPNGQSGAEASAQAAQLNLSEGDKRNLRNVSNTIDAALRKQMQKLSGRMVYLLTVGPSPSQLESSTVRALSELFSKVKIRSISDLPNANELVSQWREDSSKTPEALAKVMATGDLTVVQWLEARAEGLWLNTWYVKKDSVMAKEVHPWGDGTLPQVTIDKLHQVILDPEMRIDG